jgi:hypothetical protein
MIEYVKYPFCAARGKKVIKGRSKIEQDNRGTKYTGSYEKSYIIEMDRPDYEKWRRRDARKQSQSMAEAIKYLFAP